MIGHIFLTEPVFRRHGTAVRFGEQGLPNRAGARAEASALRLWVAFGLDGYAITSPLATGGPSNPLLKTVAQATGAWLDNYGRMPIAIIVPVLGYAGALLAIALTAVSRPGLAFIASSLSCAGVVGTVGVSTFPFLLPSSSHLASSLTVWDASSSRLTLAIMAGAVVIFMPLILAYTSWVFAVLRGAITERDIESEGGSMY